MLSHTADNFVVVMYLITVKTVVRLSSTMMVIPGTSVDRLSVGGLTLSLEIYKLRIYRKDHIKQLVLPLLEAYGAR